MGYTAISAIAAAVSSLAALCTIWLVLRQARGAEGLTKATFDLARITRHVGRNDVVMHFTRSYHEIRRGSPIDFSDPSHKIRTYEFWGLQHLEFFFFKQGDISADLYGPWMIDLVGLYLEDEAAWNSHAEFLKGFRRGYPAMYDFFYDLHKLANQYSDADQKTVRDNKVLDLVRKELPDPEEQQI